MGLESVDEGTHQMEPRDRQAANEVDANELKPTLNTQLSGGGSMTEPGQADSGCSEPDGTDRKATSDLSQNEQVVDEIGISQRLPQPAVGRLSLYYRELMRLLDAGDSSINSQELGRLVDVSPAVVRRDLSALGTIGRRGVGYDIAVLVDRIGSVLGSGEQWSVILVGVGSLGHALLRYRGFERMGFRLSAAFDNDPKLIGTNIGGIEVLDSASLEAVLQTEPAELAILALPAEHAGDVAARLLACEINGILNFAPTTLRLGDSVAVVNVDLASELQRLAFAVQSQK
jgi:redox-sensing transcriptional repressor